MCKLNNVITFTLYLTNIMKDRTIQKAFEYFFRKFYKQNNFQFYFSPQNYKIYQSLLVELGKKVSVATLGNNFLWKYCIFQFTYWEDLTLTNPSNKITFSYIFGKKAIERYFNRNKEYDWQLESSLLVSKYILSKTEFNIHIEQVKDQLEFSNNPIRFKFLNTDKGLATCLSFTTLIDRKDSSCIACKFQDTCTELLKTNYPNLYKSRYGK